ALAARCRIVELILAGRSPGAAAAACGASRATGYRVWARCREGDWSGLIDRPSTPLSRPRRLSPAVEAEIAAARARTQAGPVVLAGGLRGAASPAGQGVRRPRAGRAAEAGGGPPPPPLAAGAPPAAPRSDTPRQP